MADNYLHGKSGAVKIGTVSYSFAKWKAQQKNKIGEVSNFTGAGYRQRIPGLTDATVTVEGPYNQGNMPFSVGTSYTWVFEYTTGVDFNVTGLIENIEASVDVDNPQGVTITVQSTGSFTATIT